MLGSPERRFPGFFAVTWVYDRHPREHAHETHVFESLVCRAIRADGDASMTADDFHRDVVDSYRRPDLLIIPARRKCRV